MSLILTFLIDIKIYNMISWFPDLRCWPQKGQKTSNARARLRPSCNCTKEGDMWRRMRQPCLTYTFASCFPPLFPAKRREIYGGCLQTINMKGKCPHLGPCRPWQAANCKGYQNGAGYSSLPALLGLHLVCFKNTKISCCQSQLRCL